MNSHRYILEPYKGKNTRFNCPGCNHRDKTFVRYIDTQTGNHISPAVGKCNREINCGYHYTPKQYFQDNNIDTPQLEQRFHLKPLPPQQKPVSFISVEIFKASLTNHEPNHFIKYLIQLFGVEITGKLVSKYFIGNSTHWPGATIFWQIDLKGKIRTGKIMLYNPSTGKRVKEPYNHITWEHKNLKQPEFELSQCFFGEHLLRDKTKPVAIVESEKTAVICSVYFPKLIWLAAGSIEGLNAEKCKVLQRRKVVLFPDLNAFDKWTVKAKELSHLGNFTVFDILEQKATEIERLQGLDLADYLIRFDYKVFTEATPAPLIHPLVNAKRTEPINWLKFPEKLKPENWLPEIQDLEQFFKVVKISGEPIKLNECSQIIDINLFIKSHLETVKAQNGNKRYTPYLERLNALKTILSLN